MKLEVEGPTEIVSIKMKEKLFLNDQVKSEFENILTYGNILPLSTGDNVRVINL